VALLSSGLEKKLIALQDNAGRYLTRQARTNNRDEAELTTLALARVAANDAAQAAGLLRTTWAGKLPPDLQAWLWGQIGRQYVWRLQAEAGEAFEQAFKLQPEGPWSDELLAAATRAALRARDWPAVLQAIARMTATEQRSPGWQFWRAQALLATGKADEGRAQLASLAPQGGTLTYFPRLAAEQLGQTPRLPAPAAALTAEERETARANSGLQRALRLIDLGLRPEGLREWNFSLRGMSDRQLMAAAQEACDRQVWDRCISASERTRAEFNLSQRFPTPYREALLAASREVGVDASYVYGLIRQESRFITDARSHVGASGLMQVMPATARWTAKKIGVPYRPELVHDAAYNLRLGTTYLKLVLDAFGGSQAMAAAAYNAGPGRPRRWREGPVLDAAIWAESIPFQETRDYVRHVLANGSVYAQLLGQGSTSVRERLGATIGPAGTADGAASVPPPADLP
jgi:soluble lytic murein transglycosylase